MIRSWLAATLRGEMPVFDQARLGSVDDVLSMAHDHGVAMLLYEQIKHNPDGRIYPQALLDRLAEIERNEVASELFRLAEARAALSCLQGAGIPVLVLKGTALAYSLYPEPYLRPRTDTDLLFQDAKAAEAAGVALEAIGYECLSLMPKPDKNAISFEVAYQRTSKHGTSQIMDIHWALANNALYGARFSNAELLTETREIPALGANAKGLGLVHAMAHACMHRVAHIPEGQGDKLIWLYDIHLLSSRFTEQDWADFLSIAKQRQLAGAFGSGLQETVTTFNTALPAEVLPLLLKLAKKERFKVSKATSSAYIDLHGLFWMTHGQRWHWFVQTLFPPVEYMRQRDGLVSAYGLPMAYAKRIYKRIFK